MYNLSLFDTEPTKRTSWKRLFDEIEPHLMLDEWISLIQPEYHPATFGRPPKDLSIMLRCFIVQNLRTLSDEATEDLIYENITVRRFIGISINETDLPDASTICRYRKFLYEKEFTKAIFFSIIEELKTEGKELKKGSLIDSTTKNSSTSKRNKGK
jgi:IS5 family transposase